MPIKIAHYIGFICFLLAAASGRCVGQISINEVCSSNDVVLQDQEGEFPDWIELYNASQTAVNLSGMYLTDDPKDTTKWQFQSGSIAPNGYFIVFASDEDEENSLPPHTSFKISQDGEPLLLFSAQKELIDSIILPFVSTDFSYGNSADGNGNRVFFSTPTPNASNNSSTGVDHILAYKPEVNPKTGVYQSPFQVSMSTAEVNGTIRYTLDGSEPNTTSAIYSEPITISSSTVVTVKVFSDNTFPSNSIVRNYIFLEDQTLPIICLSTDPGYFFDPDTGIYVLGPNASSEFPYYGANFWSDTEVPVFVQWIDTYGNLGFEQKMGTRIHGGSVSRTRPMRSLRMLADDKYGKDEVEYQLFSTKIQPKNKRFILRNSGSDYLKTMFRDGFTHNVFISNNLHLDAVCFNPVEVYLNGEFWGIHNVREKIDRFYPKYNYGYDENDIDMLEEQDEIVDGNYDVFDAHEALILDMDLSEEANFQIADSLFDIRNIADYNICQTYINNLDWPFNNLKFWRARVDSSKWRYVIFDLDAALGGVNFAPYDFDALGRAMGSHGDTNRHVIILRKLLENENYYWYYINRYCDLVNTVFSPPQFTGAVDRAAARIEAVIPRHFERWNSETDNWYEEIDHLKTFLTERPPYAIRHVQEFYELADQAQIHLNVYPPKAGAIQLNSVSLKEFPFNGIYFEDVPIFVSVLENAGYQFSHWESNRTEQTGSNNLEQRFLPNNGDSLTAVFIGPAQYETISVYPNPASSSVNVEFVVNHKQSVKIELSDVNGRSIESLYEAQLQAGTHKLKLAISKRLEGMFVLSVKTEDACYTSKLILTTIDY